MDWTSIGDFIDCNRDSITAISTLVVAIFTVVLAVVTWRQANLTKIAAKAALRSAEISEKALLGLERPWLFLEGVAVQRTHPPNVPNAWSIRLHWKNVGRTPAILKSCSIKFEDKVALPVMPNYDNSGPLNVPMTVGVDIDFETNEVGTAGPTEKNGRAIEYVAYGQLVYKELNGITHTTSFAFSISPSLPATATYSNENYINYD